MIKNALTPKYWVAHFNDQSDVILESARKTMTDVTDYLDDKFGDNWRDEYPTLEVALISLEMVVFE